MSEKQGGLDPVVLGLTREFQEACAQYTLLREKWNSLHEELRSMEVVVDDAFDRKRKAREALIGGIEGCTS